MNLSESRTIAIHDVYRIVGIQSNSFFSKFECLENNQSSRTLKIWSLLAEILTRPNFLYLEKINGERIIEKGKRKLGLSLQ